VALGVFADRHFERAFRLPAPRAVVRRGSRAAIEQALQYGLFDLGRLEDLILRQVAGDFFALGVGEDDDA
jgi:hypothetical protein